MLPTHLGVFMRTSWLIGSVVVGLLLSPAIGSAQIADKLKLGLHANAFSYASFNSGGGRDAENDLSIGPFAPGSTANSIIGVPPGGLDIGYGTSESVVIGMLLRLGFSELDTGGFGGSRTVGVIGFMPHVDFVFAQGSSFRPYIGAVGGISHVTSGNGATFASVGIEGGGFGFVGESFSLGPRAAFTYSPGVSSSVSELSVIAFELQLELAGWI